MTRRWDILLKYHPWSDERHVLVMCSRLVWHVLCTKHICIRPSFMRRITYSLCVSKLTSLTFPPVTRSLQCSSTCDLSPVEVGAAGLGGSGHRPPGYKVSWIKKKWNSFRVTPTSCQKSFSVAEYFYFFFLLSKKIYGCFFSIGTSILLPSNHGAVIRELQMCEDNEMLTRQCFCWKEKHVLFAGHK